MQNQKTHKKKQQKHWQLPRAAYRISTQRWKISASAVTSTSFRSPATDPTTDPAFNAQQKLYSIFAPLALTFWYVCLSWRSLKATKASLTFEAISRWSLPTLYKDKDSVWLHAIHFVDGNSWELQSVDQKKCKQTLRLPNPIFLNRVVTVNSMCKKTLMWCIYTKPAWLCQAPCKINAMVAERLKGLDGDRLFKHFHLVEALGITPEPSKLAPDIDTGSTFALCKTQRQTTIS